jgi:hypothetical protein
LGESAHYWNKLFIQARCPESLLTQIFEKMLGDDYSELVIMWEL